MTNENYDLIAWERMYDNVLRQDPYTGVECLVGYKDVLPALIDYMQYKPSMFTRPIHVDTLLEYYTKEEMDAGWTFIIVQEMLEELRKEPYISMLEDGTFDLNSYEAMALLENRIKKEINDYLVWERDGEYFSKVCEENGIDVDVIEWDDDQITMEIRMENEEYTFSYESSDAFLQYASQDVWMTIFDNEDHKTILDAGFSMDATYLLLSKGILYEKDLSYSIFAWTSSEMESEYNLYCACKKFRDSKLEWVDSFGVEYFSDWALRV